VRLLDRERPALEADDDDDEPSDLRTPEFRDVVLQPARPLTAPFGGPPPCALAGPMWNTAARGD